MPTLRALNRHCKPALRQEAAGVQIAEKVYALDSATMDLLVGPWVRFRDTKAAVKLHTLLDLRGSLASVRR